MNDPLLKRTITELADALQVAVLIARRQRTRETEASQDAASLEDALRRATNALKRLEPST